MSWNKPAQTIATSDIAANIWTDGLVEMRDISYNMTVDDSFNASFSNQRKLARNDTRDSGVVERHEQSTAPQNSQGI